MPEKTYTLFIRVFIAFSLLFIGTVFYQYALEGGSYAEDLEWIYANLPRLRFYMSVAIICTVIAFELVILAPMSTKFRIFVIFIFACVVAMTMSVDTGVDLQHHGMYNALIFSIAVCLLVSLITVTTLGVTRYGAKACCGVSIFLLLDSDSLLNRLPC
jgi:hypothetical protein